MSARAATSAAKKVIPPLLPFRTKIANGALSIRVQDFDYKYFDETKEMFVAEAGEGFHKEETTDEFLKYRLNTGRCILFVEEEMDKPAGCILMNDSPLCRSTFPILRTLNSMVSKHFRGYGIIREAYKIIFPINIGDGYFGISGRAALTTRNIIPSIAAGGNVSATIPMCSYVDKFGYVDNVVLFMSHQLHKTHPEHYQQLIDKHNVELPPLNTDNSVAERRCSWNELPTAETKTDCGMIRIQSVREPEEVVEAHRIMRSAAEKGQGFAVDEFDQDGYCNLKFFMNSDVIVAQNTSGEIIGTAVQGPSLLARNPAPIMANQYITVKEEHRNKGIASSLLTYGIRSLKSQGYKAVISDAYVTNHTAIRMITKKKFMFRGSLPYCGYIKGEGMRDSLLVHLKI